MTGPRKLGGKVLTFGMLTGSLLVAACSADTGKILGLEKTTPDEFAVVSRAPLSLPPDYGLRPPDPNGQRYQDLKPQLDAQRAVFGDEAVQRRLDTEAQLRRAGVSQGEMSLLDRTGAIEASPEIRLVVDEETAALAAEQDSFVNDLVFWRDSEKAGDVIDANEETRRLQGNAALGVPVTEGQTPIITREGEKSWFEWPF
ncbi:MAG: DUF3035 domain-containing protein [Alphaproteobacteria bacterium]|nr:DUF3035 domain-containing protein [Alphaproteobacteria bacterium]MBO6865019.1 DUF3035 domain-containing protein [Alphaproteobacteria bacterium]